MAKPISKTPITARELLVYRAELKGAIFRQIHQRLETLRKEPHGFSQKDLALRINADPAVVSRRLAGENDMQLETLCDMARGLECRIEVQLTPLDVIAEENEPAFRFYNFENSGWEGGKRPDSQSANAGKVIIDDKSLDRAVVNPQARPKSEVSYARY